MATINFKKEHFERMKELAIEMLLDNGGVQTKMGQHLGISELLHTTTIICLVIQSVEGSSPLSYFKYPFL